MTNPLKKINILFYESLLGLTCFKNDKQLNPSELSKQELDFQKNPILKNLFGLNDSFYSIISDNSANFTKWLQDQYKDLSLDQSSIKVSLQDNTTEILGTFDPNFLQTDLKNLANSYQIQFQIHNQIDNQSSPQYQFFSKLKLLTEQYLQLENINNVSIKTLSTDHEKFKQDLLACDFQVTGPRFYQQNLPILSNINSTVIVSINPVDNFHYYQARTPLFTTSLEPKEVICSLGSLESRINFLHEKSKFSDIDNEDNSDYNIGFLIERQYWSSKLAFHGILTLDKYPLKFTPMTPVLFPDTKNDEKPLYDQLVMRPMDFMDTSGKLLCRAVGKNIEKFQKVHNNIDLQDDFDNIEDVVFRTRINENLKKSESEIQHALTEAIPQDQNPAKICYKTGGFYSLKNPDNFHSIISYLTNSNTLSKDAHTKAQNYLKSKVKNPEVDVLDTANEISEQKLLSDIRFPVILKTNIACSSSRCHDMTIFTNAESLVLDLLKKSEHFTKDPSVFKTNDDSYVIMNYHHHGSVVIKSYMFGEKFFYDLDFSLDEQLLKKVLEKTTEHELVGDVKKKPENFKTSVLKKWKEENMEDTELGNEFLSKAIFVVTKKLREVYCQDLIGVDLVVDEKTRQLVVIDVNYFSSGKSQSTIAKIFCDAVKNGLMLDQSGSVDNGY